MTAAAELRVEAPADVVWAALLDVECLAGAVPGASVERAERLVRGTVPVRLAGAAAEVRGAVRVVDADEDARAATFHAQGRPAGGGAALAATVRVRVVADGDSSRLAVEADVAGAPGGAALADDVVCGLARRLAEQRPARGRPAWPARRREAAALAAIGAFAGAAVAAATLLLLRRRR